MAENLIVNLQFVNGKSTQIVADPSWSVNKFRSTALPDTQCKLVFNGTLLQDDRLLADASIRAHDRILVLPIISHNIKHTMEEPVIKVTPRLISLVTTGKADHTPERAEDSARSSIFSLLSRLHPLAMGRGGTMPSSLHLQPTLRSPQPPVLPSNAPAAATTVLVPAPSVQVDEQALAQLLEMGFPENRSRRALLMHRNNTQIAMEYLLQHAGQADEPPLTTEQTAQIASESSFQVDPSAAAGLRDMGFSQAEVEQALRLTHNNQQAAAVWLLGDRQVPAAINVPTDPSAGAPNLNILDALLGVLRNPNGGGVGLEQLTALQALLREGSVNEAENEDESAPAEDDELL
eukprot:GILJ01005403.1.p1 GENE.GILJ01005403.1~~GILJ01005403.1.p1  ORF type:complete len:348 (-),score=63.49 GILJ01005403.1:253-1296(-)